VDSHSSAVANVRHYCCGIGCGCADLNLRQNKLWRQNSQYAAIGICGVCTDMRVVEALPYHMRHVVDGELLAQSIPLWLFAQPDNIPTEVLMCLSTQAGSGCTCQSLRGSELCLDLCPTLPHRRLRNERTGALRIYIPQLRPNEPLRVTCLWQDDIDPAQCRHPAVRLSIYSSRPVGVNLPRPSRGWSGQVDSCVTPQIQHMGWQAAVLLAGGWTPGFSSGFGSLRNPQVCMDCPMAPARGEELQLNFYLSIPHVKQESSSELKCRPTIAFTVFTRQETHAGGQPDRLLDGQLRRELLSSKAAIGGYVTAQLIVNGADARQSFHIVLQNSNPQESWQWQLRVLLVFARCRPA